MKSSWLLLCDHSLDDVTRKPSSHYRVIAIWRHYYKVTMTILVQRDIKWRQNEVNRSISSEGHSETPWRRQYDLYFMKSHPSSLWCYLGACYNVIVGHQITISSYSSGGFNVTLIIRHKEGVAGAFQLSPQISVIWE